MDVVVGIISKVIIVLVPIVEINALLLLVFLLIKPVVRSSSESLLLADSLRVLEKIVILSLGLLATSLRPSHIDWLNFFFLLV